MKNAVSAFFYGEIYAADGLEKEIDTIKDLLKIENQEEADIIETWLKNITKNKDINIIKEDENKMSITEVIERTLKETKLEGKLERNREIAQKLLLSKMPVEEIAKITELTISEINKLAWNMLN
jgi:predicted transposase YdaD